MKFLVCNSELTPCPPDAQVWSTTAEILDPAEFGIDAETITKVYGWGFGAVLGAFLIGYVLGIALGLIRKA